MTSIHISSIQPNARSKYFKEGFNYPKFPGIGLGVEEIDPKSKILSSLEIDSSEERILYGAGGKHIFYPVSKVWESKKNYHISMYIPGVFPHNLIIEYIPENHEIHVKAKRSQVVHYKSMGVPNTESFVGFYQAEFICKNSNLDPEEIVCINRKNNVFELIYPKERLEKITELKTLKENQFIKAHKVPQIHRKEKLLEEEMRLEPNSPEYRDHIPINKMRDEDLIEEDI